MKVGDIVVNPLGNIGTISNMNADIFTVDWADRYHGRYWKKDLSNPNVHLYPMPKFIEDLMELLC